MFVVVYPLRGLKTRLRGGVGVFDHFFEGAGVFCMHARAFVRAYIRLSRTQNPRKNKFHIYLYIGRGVLPCRSHKKSQLYRQFVTRTKTDDRHVLGGGGGGKSRDTSGRAFYRLSLGTNNVRTLTLGGRGWLLIKGGEGQGWAVIYTSTQVIDIKR